MEYVTSERIFEKANCKLKSHKLCQAESVKNERKKKKKKKKKSYPVEAGALIVCQRNAAVLLAEITRPRDTGGCLRSCCNESFRSAIKFNSQSEIRVKVAS